MNWKSVLTPTLALCLIAGTCAAQNTTPPPVASPNDVQKFTEMMNAAGSMLATLKNQHDQAQATRAADPNAPPRPLRDPKVSVMLVTGGAAGGAAIGAGITGDGKGAILGAVAGAIAGLVYDRMTYRNKDSN